MPIEKDLKDNTAALKANTEMLQKLYDLKAGTPVPVAAAPVAAQPVAVPIPAAEVAVAQPVPAAPIPAITAAPVATAAPVVAQPAPVASVKEMNTILVSEFKRIGSREPIDAAMISLGVNGVAELPADKQQELIAKIAAIQPL